MKLLQIEPGSGFRVLTSTSRSQVATMVLGAGTSTGGPDNQHAHSDQWLYVLSGEGKATVNGEDHTLRPGSLLLLEAGDTHEIANTGQGPLETFNIYAPPAY
jgi:mannose-6-phosphate isomerase-like protein (cupin superfamily)